MSGRFLVVGSIIYILFFLGLITMTGGFLVLALPLVIYLGAALLHQAPDVQLTVTRSVSADTIKQHTPVKVLVHIFNHGPDLEEVLVEDQLPKGVELVEGDTRSLLTLPHGATLDLEYTVKAPRGSYYFQAVQVTAGDHLGVMRKQVVLEARAKLVFMPESMRLRRIAIRPPRTHGHSGPIPARQAGAGVDFYGLREYQLGDPRRWINWRASARHEQKLFVNQFEQERIADVGLILDARQQANIVLPDGDSLFEYSIRATAALSEAFLNDGNRVGLLIYGFGMERTFPGYGKVQQQRIMRALGQARTGHNFALESLRYLPTRFFPAGSQIVVISPMLAADIPAFTRLRANGYEVMVISPDPVDFEARGMRLKDDTVWKLAQMERVLILRELQRRGVRVLDWQVNRPFEPLVRTSLGRAAPVHRVMKL